MNMSWFPVVLVISLNPGSKETLVKVPKIRDLHPSKLFPLSQRIPIRQVVSVLIFRVIPKEVGHVRIVCFNSPLGEFITDIRYMGMLAKQALSQVNLAPYDSNMPFHLAIFLIILST
jgi:hypothetical protein